MLKALSLLARAVITFPMFIAVLLLSLACGLLGSVLTQFGAWLHQVSRAHTEHLNSQVGAIK